MDRAALAAPNQEILRSGSGRPSRQPDGHSAPTLGDVDEEAAFASLCATAERAADLLDVLGAAVLDGPRGPCVVVDRDYDLSFHHGRHRVERYHGAARASAGSLTSFLPNGKHTAGAEPPVEAPLLFFDLETTGLAGGAGTYAVLVGFGYYTADGFHTRQFLLRGFGEERAQLESVREFIAARDRHESLALGRLFEFLARPADAERCFAAAAAREGPFGSGQAPLARADALPWLALHWRRRRRFQDAAEAWRELAEISGLDAAVRRKALEALAIHHEHRARDLEAARGFALRALDLAGEDVRHRLGRLDLKLKRAPRQAGGGVALDLQARTVGPKRP